MHLAENSRIVIVGGGAGGLELATRLGRRYGRRGELDVTLVDRTYSHLWKPLLHEVAAGTLNSSEDELSYLAQSHWNHFAFRVGALEGLDRANRTITIGATLDAQGREYIPERILRYDLLVLISAPRVSPSTAFFSTSASRRTLSINTWYAPATRPTPAPSRYAPDDCTSRSRAPARHDAPAPAG